MAYAPSFSRHHHCVGPCRTWSRTGPDIGSGLDDEVRKIWRQNLHIASPSFATIEKLSEILEVPEVVFFGVGLIVTTDSERTRILSKIQTKLSRLNEDQLVRADKMLGALTD